MRLTRAHTFLSERTPAEIESHAERLFGALGYRRLERSGLVFGRGRPLGALVATSIRGCATEVTVTCETPPAGKESATLVAVRHRVQTLLRIPWPSDRAILDAEVKIFEHYLDSTQSVLDLAPLERAFARAGHAATVRTIVLVVAGVVGAAYLVSRGGL